VILTVFLLTSVTSDLSAQNQSAVDMSVRATKERLIQRAPDYSYSITDGETTYARQAQLSDLVPDAWDIHHQMVQGRDANVNPKPPMTPEEFTRLQSKLTYRQQLNSQGVPSDGQENIGAPGQPLEVIPNQSRSSAIIPKVGVEVQSTYNAPNSSVPDGAAAVNSAGKIVVANNTHIEIFDEDGTQLYSQTEGTFWSVLNPTANIYDPRIEYDTFNNRFIIVELHGNQPTLTQIYIAVSKTSNPENGWWFYEFNGNSGDSNLWFDYPQIAYSDETLTVAGNMFTATGNSSTESKVHLFELYDAYDGLNVSHWYFDDVEAGTLGWNEYSIKPCSYPFGIYGPGLYMINRDDADDIAWWDISANAGNNPTLNGWIVDVGTINNPVNAPQSGGPALTVGARLQSAYVDVSGEDKIHFTYAISDSNGDDRIFLGRLNTSNENVVSQQYGAPGKDYAYPWIMPWTTNSGAWNGGSLVAFLRVSSTSFPEFRVAHGYPNSTDWGNSVLVKSGESAIGAGNRWGDYLGGGFREGQSDPECWIYGQYGLNNDHGMWLAQISLNLEGCTNPLACNYDPSATLDDGSCDLVSCAGCTDSNACNYNPNAVIDDGSCTTPGCTSWGACNFSFSAGCDDGSCCYDNCVRLRMTDTYGDGWNGATYSLANSSGVVVTSGTMGTGYEESVLLPCLPDGCYEFTVTNGSFPSEIGWSLENVYMFILIGVDYTFASGGAGETQSITIGGGGDEGGCTDATACNYDTTALCDNNTCCFSSCVTVSMTDSYGDGWNNNIWEIRHNGDLVSSGTLDVGYSGIDVACLDPGCYNFSINSDEGMYNYEIGWTLDGINEIMTGNYATEVQFTVDGGGPDVGCMDLNACNYDVNVICDDGSCCYENCGVLTMMDTYGDGWNGANLTITDDNGIVIGTYTFNSGYGAEAEICLLDGCYIIDVSSGSWPSEVGWIIQFPNHMLGGGALYNEQFNLFTIEGCTDETSCNYNPLATCDNGTCSHDGCGDLNACNYESGCDLCHVQQLCDFSCVGCTYIDAINYGGASVTIDDGTCEFSASASCDGDLDGNGQVNTNDLLLFLATFGTTCI